MSDEDKTKWDAKYARVDAAPSEPSRLLVDLGDMLPARGTALDVAGGTGRHAIWLAQRGLNVTIADVSEVGLNTAMRRARSAGVSLRTISLDLESQPPPQGPWDLVLCVQFLHRPLFEVFPHILRPGGILIVIHPTRSNLQRHEKPPARFLLEDGELPKLVGELEILRYEEGWLGDNRHDAVLVACRR